MIEGILVIIVGTMLNFAAPAHDLLASRRQARNAAMGPLLVQAYPFARPSDALDALMVRTDAALERDRLVRGVAGVTIVYDQAVPPR